MYCRQLRIIHARTLYICSKIAMYGSVSTVAFSASQISTSQKHPRIYDSPLTYRACTSWIYLTCRGMTKSLRPSWVFNDWEAHFAGCGLHGRLPSNKLTSVPFSASSDTGQRGLSTVATARNTVRKVGLNLPTLRRGMG